MKPLYLDWNLGLGDAIICNGLVRFLALTGEPLILPCWERNLPTVRHMFGDLNNVRVAPVDHRLLDLPLSTEIRSIGVNNPAWGIIEPWDRAFYEFASVPFDAKWDLFHVPESGTEFNHYGDGFALIHEDVVRGFEIDGDQIKGLCDPALEPVMMVPGIPRLTDWRNLIGRAREIHCIDSAPMHLVELLPTRGKLFYHKYARAKKSRNHVDATFRKPWVVLE